MKAHISTNLKEHIRDNSGFSLVELLVAVAIVAIVFTPILKSFTTAAVVNSRAQRTQNATSLAESVMEDVKGKSVEQLYSEASLTMPSAPPYEISYSGVTATQGVTYDVDVKLSIDEYADTDRYDERKANIASNTEDYDDVRDANLVALPKMQDIDSSQNAVLSWEINEYDGVAFEAILDKNVEDTTGDYWADKSWWGGIRKLLGGGEKTLKIELTEDESDIRVHAEAIYDPHDPGYTPISYTLYNSSFEKDKMEDVYIFYTVMKDDAEARKRQEEAAGHAFYMFFLGKESIEIVDSTSHEHNIYLVVQNITTEFEISGIDNSNHTVTIKDKKAGETTVVIKNITSDDSGFKINGHKTFTNFSYSIAEGGQLVYMPANLYETETKSKLYYVTVDVKDTDGNILATLTSTKPTGDEVN